MVCIEEKDHKNTRLESMKQCSIIRVLDWCFALSPKIGLNLYHGGLIESTSNEN